VILDNGVIRTMDPSLPTCGALAIAGPLVAGGVGTHESALPSHDRVDLGGRCVIPAFTDAHVHFPTWALARRDIPLDGVSSLAEALDRVAGHPRSGGWIRGTGWRDALWAEHPTSKALDTVTGATPAALWAKDYHSLWLNTAALAFARGALDVPGGVVERDGTGEPTGILREEAAWRFRDDGCRSQRRNGSTRRERGSASLTAAGWPPFTTRTAGSARLRSSVASTRAKD